MHLVLGHPEDSCCDAVMASLAARGCAVRRVTAALAAPSRLGLRIDPDGGATAELALGDGPAEQIESVLVRAGGTVDAAGWDAADHAYMQAEVQAATLAWLSAIECPVVNAVDAQSWYRPRKPLLYWRPLLSACGLEIPEIVVTDNATAADEFRQSLEACEVPGAIFRSIARDEGWLVGPEDWGGVAALQPHGPVCLVEPHGATILLCIVGSTVVWGTEPPPPASALSARLLRFAERAGLAFVEIALARVRSGLAVVHVDPLPILEHFDGEVRARIIGALTDLLAGQVSDRPAEAPT